MKQFCSYAPKHRDKSSSWGVVVNGIPLPKHWQPRLLLAAHVAVHGRLMRSDDKAQAIDRQKLLSGVRSKNDALPAPAVWPHAGLGAWIRPQDVRHEGVGIAVGSALGAMLDV